MTTFRDSPLSSVVVAFMSRATKTPQGGGATSLL